VIENQESTDRTNPSDQGSVRDLEPHAMEVGVKRQLEMDIGDN